MPSHLTYKYLGDKRAAKVLRHAGLHHLGILKNAMRFQGLQQNRRVVEFSDGTCFICTSVFNIDTVNIYVPPLLPVSGERKVIKEEYCFCSHYFTEGTIIEIITSELDEGSYPPFYNKYKYYTEIFTGNIATEADYNGVRYKVRVCRGVKETMAVCAASDLTTYGIGDKVILFCVGNYILGDSRWVYSPDSLKLFPGGISCSGRTGNCFSCKADMKPVTTIGELEGTYVIVPLSFERTTNIAGDTFELVTAKQLERGNVYKATVMNREDSPELEGISGMIDFANNTVSVMLSNNDSVIARVCCNGSKLPLTYANRARMVVFDHVPGQISKWSLLAIEGSALDHVVIGYRFNTPARYPYKTLKGVVRFYYDGAAEEYKLINISNKDTNQALDIIVGATWDEEDTKYVTIEGTQSYFIVTTPRLLSSVQTNTGPVPFNWHTYGASQTVNFDNSFDGSSSGYSYGETYYYSVFYAKDSFITQLSNGWHWYRDCSKTIDLQPLVFYGAAVGYDPGQGQYSKPKPICYLSSEIHAVAEQEDWGEGLGYNHFKKYGEKHYKNKDQVAVFTHEYEEISNTSSSAPREITLTHENELRWEQIIPVKTLGNKILGVLQVHICKTWEVEVLPEEEYLGIDAVRPPPAEDNIDVYLTLYMAEDITDVTNCSLDEFDVIGDTGTFSVFIEALRANIKTAYIYWQNNYPEEVLVIDAVDGFCIDNT